MRETRQRRQRRMAAIREAEEELLLSCLMSAASSPPCIYPHMSQGGEMAGGEGKPPRRRRRRKPGGGDGSAAEAKKRRLSDEQVRFLETSFGAERKLESGRKVQLAAELGLEPKQVAVWFQNRRSRWKNKQLEEEFVHLKSAHHQAILDKCQLEKEVLMLKEKLSKTEEEVKKLTTSSTASVGGERGRGVGSPCSSFSTGTYQPFLGELEADGGAPELLYINEYSDMMDWGNFYGI